MKGLFAPLIISIGMALVITALTLQGRQTPAVIDSLGWGASRLEEASLGMRP